MWDDASRKRRDASRFGGRCVFFPSPTFQWPTTGVGTTWQGKALIKRVLATGGVKPLLSLRLQNRRQTQHKPLENLGKKKQNAETKSSLSLPRQKQANTAMQAAEWQPLMQHPALLPDKGLGPKMISKFRRMRTNTYTPKTLMSFMCTGSCLSLTWHQTHKGGGLKDSMV